MSQATIQRTTLESVSPIYGNPCPFDTFFSLFLRFLCEFRFPLSSYPTRHSFHSSLILTFFLFSFLFLISFSFTPCHFRHLYFFFTALIFHFSFGSSFYSLFLSIFQFILFFLSFSFICPFFLCFIHLFLLLFLYIFILYFRLSLVYCF